MSSELEILAWMSALTIAMWLPYILAHIANVGLMPALTYRADETPLPNWAARARKAHYNTIENLVPFVSLIIVAHLSNATNEVTASAALAYFWLRLSYYVLYTLGIPFGRTLTFAGSWIAQIFILMEILT